MQLFNAVQLWCGQHTSYPGPRAPFSHAQFRHQPEVDKLILSRSLAGQTLTREAWWEFDQTLSSWVSLACETTSHALVAGLSG